MEKSNLQSSKNPQVPLQLSTSVSISEMSSAKTRISRAPFKGEHLHLLRKKVGIPWGFEEPQELAGPKSIAERIRVDLTSFSLAFIFDPIQRSPVSTVPAKSSPSLGILCLGSHTIYLAIELTKCLYYIFASNARPEKPTMIWLLGGHKEILSSWKHIPWSNTS